jgi:hypothetical protein
MNQYITNYDESVNLPYEDGLLEWLQEQYPFSKYRIVEVEFKTDLGKLLYEHC